ncbi:MAG TPA: twin-arginine translocation signal domain-containing protein, partial [Candidatus Methylomirabilis sp.]|nr:twin-arginine translocation signal domain-containing protein [Candidatus Methylomirabilis sp.]
MNRRDFLKAGAAGLALTAAGSYAAEFADQKPQRVGLI